jgi:acetyl-CoA carboxylase biotin carboxyl carrier protein
MDLKYVKSLLKLFDESTATEITIDEEGGKIKLSKKADKSRVDQQYYVPQQYNSAPAAVPVQTVNNVTNEETSSTKDENAGLHEVTSPIVGTFYKTPSPDSDPFVKVGDRVEVGQTLCIVEAMKVMNEIESDASGIIEKIVVDNAQPVEYNQVLFLIKAE